jgi:hypothetical protein
MKSMKDGPTYVPSVELLVLQERERKFPIRLIYMESLKMDH